MASRETDWMAQAERDLLHAHHSTNSGDYEWACFAAHQAAEKAVKALFQSLGAQVILGHSLMNMLQEVGKSVQAPKQELDGLLESARNLDRHYIPTRYPDAYPSGAPFQYYTRHEALEAIAHGDKILRFCKSRLPGPQEGAEPGAPGG